MNKKEVEKQLKDYPAALTVKEAAEILRVSTKLLYRMIKEKTLPATKIGREKRIAKCHLISYLRAKEPPDSNPKCVVSCFNEVKTLTDSGKSWTSAALCDMYVPAKKVADGDGTVKYLATKRKGLIKWQA